MAAPQAKLVDRTVQQQQATNLTILQRKDEAISEILTTATYVVIYLYNAASQEWTKKEIEGSLFVVKRSFGCRFRFIILNRVNNEDLEEDITADMSFEEMDPFLMYRKNNGGEEDAETHAIWFHNAKERSAILTCMRRVLKTQVLLQRKDSGSGDQGAAVASIPTIPAETAPKPSAASMLLQSKQPEPSAMTKTLQDLLLRKASGTENGAGSDEGAAIKQDTETPAPINRAGSALLQQLLLKPKTAAPVPSTEGENGVEKAPAPPSGLMALLRGTQPPAPKAPTKAAAPGGVVLDKEQLKGVLLDLIQDDSFLETLHTAYLSKLRMDSPAENP